MDAGKTTILVADDDAQLLRFLQRVLELEGYVVMTASDGEQAMEQMAMHEPDLLLLDVMMPKLDGYTVCQRVREFSHIPIIILTARGQEQEKGHGLDVGADDYLPKPFSITELLARIRAILRRAELATNGQNGHISLTRASLSIGELEIDFRQHQAKRAGRELILTHIEYRLLTYLVQHAGQVLTQSALLEQVWGKSYVGERHLLQVNISRLRHKVEPDPVHPRYILTRAGIGYLCPL